MELKSDQQSLMSTAELSEFLRCPRSTLYAWRANGKGPAWMKLSGLIRYRREDVEAFINEARDRELERRKAEAEKNGDGP